MTGRPGRTHHQGTYQVRAQRVRLAAAANPWTRCWRSGRTLAEHEPPQRQATVMDGRPRYETTTPTHPSRPKRRRATRRPARCSAIDDVSRGARTGKHRKRESSAVPWMVSGSRCLTMRHGSRGRLPSFAHVTAWRTTAVAVAAGSRSTPSCRSDAPAGLMEIPHRRSVRPPLAPATHPAFWGTLRCRRAPSRSPIPRCLPIIPRPSSHPAPNGRYQHVERSDTFFGRAG